MPQTLSARAIDQSTFIVVVSFFDEENEPVTPTSINWTLTDIQGNVINSKDSVSVGVPDTSINIVLSGDDLDYADGLERVVTIEAVYSSTLGSNLPLRDQVRFTIQDLIVVS